MTVAYSLFVQTATTNTPEYVINASKPIPLPVKKLQKKTTKHAIKDLLHQNHRKSPNSTFIKERTNWSRLSLVHYLLLDWLLLLFQKNPWTASRKGPQGTGHADQRWSTKLSKQLVANHLLQENITSVPTSNASVWSTQLELVLLQSPARCSVWKLQYCNKEEIGLQPVLFSIN